MGWPKGKKRTFSPVHRSNLSLSKIGVKRPDLIGNKFRSKRHPWNYKKKNVYSVETLAKMSEAKLGGVRSDVENAKRRRTMVRRWKDKNYRARHNQAMKKHGQKMLGLNNVSQRPEVRAKMSATASRLDVIAKKERLMPYSGTTPELAMRSELKRRGIVFLSNHQILKKYNADIFIKPNIVIECDGNYWHSLERVRLKDRIKDKALKKAGYVVYRFWEKDIKADVCACVDKIILL